MVKIHHAAMSVAALFIAGAGVFAAQPAGAATTTGAPQHQVQPNEILSRNCGNGNTGGNEWDCIEVRQDPYSVVATDHINHSERTVQVCVHFNGLPDGCTPYEIIKPGQTESSSFDYKGAGTYCARVWRMNPDGSRTEVDPGQCVTMH